MYIRRRMRTTWYRGIERVYPNSLNPKSRFIRASRRMPKVAGPRHGRQTHRHRLNGYLA